MTFKNQTIGILTAVAIITCLVVGGRWIVLYKLERDRVDWKIPRFQDSPNLHLQMRKSPKNSRC